MGMPPAATTAASAAASRPDVVAHVVETLSPLLERLGDGRIGAGRGEQLHVAVGHAEKGFLNTVTLDDLGGVQPLPRRPDGSSRRLLRGR